MYTQINSSYSQPPCPDTIVALANQVSVVEYPPPLTFYGQLVFPYVLAPWPAFEPLLSEWITKS